MTTLLSLGPARLADMPYRLDALSEMVKMGRSRDGFSTELLDDTDALIRRAGERLRLSAGHTVVAIAGGTGSGKSTLFNALAGAEFSPPGVTRPTTRDVHACVWGMEDAEPLLDWLDVGRRNRYERASALDSGESALHGLVLLDLPDHDSVIESSKAVVDKVTKLADVLIWVLDPQKYADAAVHNSYLVPLAAHAGMFTVVLTQTDLLTPEQAEDCAEDLRRLLDSEGLDGTRLLLASGRTGQGLSDLRGLLANVVSTSRTATERVSGDIDSVLPGFAEYAGPAVQGTPPPALSAAPSSAAPPAESSASAVDVPDSGGPESGGSEMPGSGTPGPEAAGSAGGRPPLPAPLAKPPWELTNDEIAHLREARENPPWEDATPEGERRELDAAALARNVPEGPASALTEALAGVTGLSAVAEGLASDWQARAARFTGWPVSRAFGWRRDPVRTLRDERAGPEGPPAAAGTGGAGPAVVSLAPAQRSVVDNVVTVFTDTVGGQLPAPWAASLRRAARAARDEVPSALADAVRAGAAVPGDRPVPVSWRLIAVWQWLLLALAAVAAIWAVVIGVAHGGQRPALLGDLSLVPWLAVAAVVFLLLGWLTALGCRNAAEAGAEHERSRAERAMRERVTATVRDLVLVPAGRELGEYERFRRELAIAVGSRG
jgi:energy-coupling factor transporter ATP-binding protein EcfA2